MVPVRMAQPSAAGTSPRGSIEIELAGGALVRVTGLVEPASLGQVLELLSRRSSACRRERARGWRRGRPTCGRASTAWPRWCRRTLSRDPFCGHVFVFRGRSGDLVKLLWWDGDGLCLLAKRLERGRSCGRAPNKELRC